MNASKKKVLLVAPFPPPYGGVANIANQLYLSDLKEIFDFRKLNVNLPEELRETVSEWKGVNLKKSASMIRRVVTILINDRPDVAIVKLSTDPSAFRASLVGLLLRLGGVRTIAYCHGRFKTGKRFFPFSLELKGQFLTTFLIDLCFRPFQRVIFISDQFAEEFRSVLSRSNSRKINIVENFVDQGEFVPSSEQHSRCRVLFVGRLSRAKGFMDLLDVIPDVVCQCPEVVFSICGTPEQEEALAPVSGVMALLQEQGFLELHGIVQGDVKRKVFGDSDIFVLPSHDENLPVAILEGMAQGLPIVATRVGAIPSIVDVPKNGLIIEPGAKDQLTNALVFLIKNPDLRKSIAETNRRKIEERFDIAIAVEKIRQIVQGVLSPW